MRFPPSFLDDIKARLPVSSVVGRRVKLSRAGHELRGLSPFNKEKSPSFFVNDAKQAWFDFSAGKNGNIFDFVMETEGLSFIEAVERLAAEAGLQVPKRTAESDAAEKRRASLNDVMDMAQAFFLKQIAGPGGAEARAYLDGRGITASIRAAFGIGYSPDDRGALRGHLAAAGVGVDAMIEAGLLVHGETIRSPFDRFRGRVIIPIHDARGRVVSFGGRALAKDVQAKYLNGPETPLFHKGGTLYNGHRARKAAHDASRLVVVEGYMDAISLSAVGIGEVVAPMGTSITEEQIAAIWRLAPMPIMCFDGDKAGRRAAYRAIQLALPMMTTERSLRFAIFPDGQDPDDVARAGGRSALEEILAGARSVFEMLWQGIATAENLRTPEGMAAVEQRLRGAVDQVGDTVLRGSYHAEIKNRLYAARRERSMPPPRKPEARPQPPARAATNPLVSALLREIHDVSREIAAGAEDEALRRLQALKEELERMEGYQPEEEGNDE